MTWHNPAMGMRRIVVAGLLLFALLAPAGARPVRKDDDDWVPDNHIAVLVAEAVLRGTMGEAAYADYVKDSPMVYGSPLQAELRGPIWYVVRRPGPRTPKSKDAFVIGVARHDARLIRPPAGRPRLPRGDLVPDAKTATAITDRIVKRVLGEEFYKEAARLSILTDGNPLMAELSERTWWVEKNYDSQAVAAEQAEAERKAGPGVTVILQGLSFTVRLSKRDGRILDFGMCCR